MTADPPAEIPLLALAFPEEVSQAFGGRLSRTKLYELVADGRLQTFTVGRQRFASIEAIRAFIAAAVAEESARRSRAD